jgi:hypothetical protein
MADPIIVTTGGIEAVRLDDNGLKATFSDTVEWSRVDIAMLVATDATPGGNFTADLGMGIYSSGGDAYGGTSQINNFIGVASYSTSPDTWTWYAGGSMWLASPFGTLIQNDARSRNTSFLGRWALGDVSLGYAVIGARISRAAPVDGSCAIRTLYYGNWSADTNWVTTLAEFQRAIATRWIDSIDSELAAAYDGARNTGTRTSNEATYGALDSVCVFWDAAAGSEVLDIAAIAVNKDSNFMA